MTTTSTPARRALRPSGRQLPEDTRRHHRALLLQLLFRDGPASRADLARSSGLTRVTVSDVVGDLVTDGLLTESVAPAQGRVGKPPVLVQLAAEARQIVAVDLSADGAVSGALLNLTGDVQERRSRPLEGRRGEDAVDARPRAGARAGRRRRRGRCSASASAPPVWWTPTAWSCDAPNLGWHGTAAGRRAARRRSTCRCFVANDANTAVLGEHTFGDAGDGGLMLVRVGTGVGAGLVLEGALLHGHRSAAGEVGHVVVDPRRRRVRLRPPRLPGDRAVRAARCGERARPRRRATQVLAEVGAARSASPSPRCVGDPQPARAGPQRARSSCSTGRCSTPSTARSASARMPVSGEELVVRTSALGDDVVLVGAAVLVLSGQLGVS